MFKNENSDYRPAKNILLRPVERDCPKCDAVLVQNDTEQCYECFKCGYIDCGKAESVNDHLTLLNVKAS